MALAAISLVLSAHSTLSRFPAHFLAVLCEVPAFSSQLVWLLLLLLCQLTVVRKVGLVALVLNHLHSCFYLPCEVLQEGFYHDCRLL